MPTLAICQLYCGVVGKYKLQYTLYILLFYFVTNIIFSEVIH